MNRTSEAFPTIPHKLIPHRHAFVPNHTHMRDKGEAIPAAPRECSRSRPGDIQTSRVADMVADLARARAKLAHARPRTQEMFQAHARGLTIVSDSSRNGV